MVARVPLFIGNTTSILIWSLPLTPIPRTTKLGSPKCSLGNYGIFDCGCLRHTIWL
jgi:hypothetical protein